MVAEVEVTSIRRVNFPDFEWDLIVDSIPESAFMHKWWLLEAQSTWKDRVDLSFLLEDQERNPLAIVPLQLVEGKIFRTFRVKRFDLYGGVILVDHITDEGPALSMKFALTRLREMMDEMGVDYTNILVPFHGDSENSKHYLSSYAHSGVHFVEGGSWVIDLHQSQDELWKKLDSKQRNMVRKAEKTGVSIRLAEREDLVPYYAMHLETCSRSGILPHPKAYFEFIWNHFYSITEAKIWIAELEGNVIAGQTFSIHHGVATYWTGASNNSARSCGANTLLQWEAIRYFQSVGLDFFENGWNSEEKTTKAGTISKFKESFGGSLKPIFVGRIESNRISSRLRNFFWKMSPLLKTQLRKIGIS
jgi:hypothetical protein